MPGSDDCSIEAQIEYCTWAFTTLLHVRAWTAGAPVDAATQKHLDRQARLVAAILETLKTAKSGGTDAGAAGPVVAH